MMVLTEIRVYDLFFFFPVERFRPPFFPDEERELFFGTFAPFSRASESPIAIACLRLFTFFPEPLLSVPRFFLRMALSTES
jgi:hypothetical protein